MYMQLMRLKDDGKSTVGTLMVNGTFKMFTLEDTHNEPKVYGETRIPAGSYDIKLRDEGGMTKKYAAKYEKHKGMLWLQDVPGFEYVYIHVGNNHEHTDGCVLVGNGCESTSGFMSITHSRDAYAKLYAEILVDIEADIPVTIEIV